jgi:RNA polymerase sigma-70 factor (ECF subfamily)
MNPQCVPPEDTPERYRQYLLTLLRARADPHLYGKVDLSGVVQQTLFDAHNVIDQWRGWSEGQRVAWLRTALANNHTDEVRKLRTDKRDAGREVSIEQSLADSSARLGGLLVADHSSPSGRAVRNEELIRLADSLVQLPDEQRLAIELHHLRGLSIAQTAQAMDRSDQSVVGLLFRGLRRLRELMG